MSNSQKFISKVLLLSIVIFLITGCGGGSSDDKELQQVNYTTIDGRVVDGEIKDAIVFYDINKNGVYDRDEPSTKSDSVGRFELKIKEEIAKDMTIPIASTGGYDIRSNLVYEHNLMAFREEGSSSVALTPLSTLIAMDLLESINSDKNLRVTTTAINTDELFKKLKESQKRFAELFDLDINIVTKDPIELAQTSSKLKLLETNMKINKVANEIKKAIKNELKEKSKYAIKSFKVLTKALKEAKKEAKKGDEALKKAVEYVKYTEPNLFNKDLIPLVKESTKLVLDEFNSAWTKSKGDMLTTVQDSKNEFINFNKDNVPPVIKLHGSNPLNIELNKSYKEYGAYAIDNKDGLVEVTIDSSKVKTDTLGSYIVLYKAVDSFGNKAEVKRVVNVVDTDFPFINLVGEKEINVTLGNDYIEMGATAFDKEDGELNVTIKSELEVGKIGRYKIEYSAVNSKGNESSITRFVNVVNPEVVVNGVDITEKRCNRWSNIEVSNQNSFYTLTDNDWGRNFLAIDKDGVQCVFKFREGNITKGGWYWGWPDNNDYQVKGYPEAVYGAKFRQKYNKDSGFPSLVDNIKSVKVDVAYRDINITKNYNIALEFWLHKSKQIALRNVEYEVMFRFDPKGFHPNKILLGQISLGGIDFDVYKSADYDDTRKRIFINFIAKKKVKNFSIDFKEALDYLQEIEFSDISQTYMSGIEMGVEVINGSGALILDKFDVNLEKKKLVFYNEPESKFNLYDTFSFVPDLNTTGVEFSIKNKPSWMELNKTTGELSGIVVDSGQFNNIELVATKGMLQKSLEFNISVDRVTDKLQKPLQEAIESEDSDKISEIAAMINYEKSISEYKNYYNSYPVNAIKAFNKYEKLKKALAAVSDKDGFGIFVLNNFNDFMKEFKDLQNIENYYNIFFGYAVQGNSSGIYNDTVFWDGWGGHIGLYGAHEVWSLEEEKLFKEKEKSIRDNGTITQLTKAQMQKFSLYLSQKYNLSGYEREIIRRSNGYYFNGYLHKAIKNGVDIRNTPLVDLIRKHNLQLPLINIYFKVRGEKTRDSNELKELIDNYMAQKGYTSYKEYFLHFKSNNGEIKRDHLGAKYNLTFVEEYLRKVVGLNGQDKVNAVSAYKLAKRTIDLAKIPPIRGAWPLINDDITQRPWHIYALDEGYEEKGCEWVKKRFFEDDVNVRVQMVNDLGVGNLAAFKKRQRLITYSTYNYAWRNPGLWYVKSPYHNEFSVPTIVREGGICGHQGTLEQHSRSCLGQPTLGRSEPIHRSLVKIVKYGTGYKAVIAQGVFDKANLGTILRKPYVSFFDFNPRRRGGERVNGIVDGLKEGNDGFDDTLTNSMILQRLAVADSNNTEFLLKKAIDAYPTNPSPWYQLAIYYAKSGEEDKVIALADEYLSRLDEIKLEGKNNIMPRDYEKATAWGIVSTLINFRTANAVEKSLQFIRDNFHYFILRGYKEMFMMLKSAKPANWKQQSQYVLETLLDINSLNTFADFAFWKNANWYWERDKEFIDQMKEIVLANKRASVTFKRNILRVFFQDTRGFIVQMEIKNNESNIVKSLKTTHKDSNNLFITTKDFSLHVNAEDMGKEGYKIINIPVTNRDNENYVLKIRVAKVYNGKLIAPNDSTGPVKESTEFRFWIDKSDNMDLPSGIYNSKEGYILHHKGHRENTYYGYGDSVVFIKNLNYKQEESE